MKISKTQYGSVMVWSYMGRENAVDWGTGKRLLYVVLEYLAVFFAGATMASAIMVASLL